MGGTIAVESRQGQGSTFRCNVKLRISPEARTFQSGKQQVNGLHALVVDDNAAASEILAEQLRALDFRVDAVNSAQSALKSIEQSDLTDPYALVLMD
jgi:PleD family two-component response regulator